jgi:hypothetical protein
LLPSGGRSRLSARVHIGVGIAHQCHSAIGMSRNAGSLSLARRRGTAVAAFRKHDRVPDLVRAGTRDGLASHGTSRPPAVGRVQRGGADRREAAGVSDHQ